MTLCKENRRFYDQEMKEQYDGCVFGGEGKCVGKQESSVLLLWWGNEVVQVEETQTCVSRSCQLLRGLEI